MIMKITIKNNNDDNDYNPNDNEIANYFKICKSNFDNVYKLL